MKTTINTQRLWNTTSFGGGAETPSGELTSLGDHLGVCKSAHGHWFALHCAAESMHGFIVARLVTTLVVGALLIGVVALAL